MPPVSGGWRRWGEDSLQVTSTRGRVRHWPVGGTGTRTLTWPWLVLARLYSSFRTIDQKISPQFLNIADQKPDSRWSNHNAVTWSRLLFHEIQATNWIYMHFFRRPKRVWAPGTRVCVTVGLLTTKVDILFALFMESKSPTIHLWLSGVSSTQQFTGLGLLLQMLLFAAAM